MLSIRKVFTKNKRNKQQKKKQNSFVSSNSSASSTTDDSVSTPTTSTPTTPTSGPFVHDTRGIFRTLEPIWYYGYYPEQQEQQDSSSVVVTNDIGQQNKVLDDEEQELDWVQFDPHCQTVLEFAYRQNKASCDLGQNCIVHFTSKNPAKSNNNNNEEDNIAWVLNETVRRVITPVWWFEQDSVIDGSKGMCRFDYKNQARLEALADEDRTKLSLVDEAFPHPFTITLVPKSRDQKEEWRGFLHYEYPAIFVNNTMNTSGTFNSNPYVYDNNRTSMMMMMKPPTMDYFYDQIEPARRMSSFHFLPQQQQQPIPIPIHTPLAVQQDGVIINNDAYYYGDNLDDAITTSGRRYSV
ncbi:hypothetical protein BDA99DRAFT_569975 [Phascolomyces articulosus]|uniref:Uncharacterized protein n=1 Tax=Phascolomyces articulosus TaxID=60185 RepID=A0AAD5PGQ6_9FUNG|nr:hypothetical protein BDA99DRAFT_569975 [Phascolomyces articulosus]